MELIVFYLLSALAIGSAIIMVSLKNIARSLFLFFVVLVSIAGLYLFALADFVAITHIMVYVGGVLILMIFAFMLSNKELMQELASSSTRLLSIPPWQSALIAVGFLFVIIYSILDWRTTSPEWILQAEKNGLVISAQDNNIEALGFRFMTRYVLPFEIISIFLMTTLIGAAHIARKEKRA